MTVTTTDTADSWLVCGAGCPGRIDVHSIGWRCESCNGLLEVRHDVEVLKKTSAEEWRRRFDGRGPQRAGLDSSGVWARREWVLPRATEDEVATLGEGWSPLTPVPALAREIGVGELWVKQCGISHTGSFKDLGMSVLVTAVKRRRKAGHEVKAVLCASTGDTSAALAAYGAAAGVPTLILLPKGKVTASQLLQPLAHGSLVIEVDTDFDGCMRLVAELAKQPGFYLANSMNPWRLEGQKTVAIEIVQQLGWQPPDWIALPGGNLGNTSAMGRGLEDAETLAAVPRHTRLLVGQVEAANPLYRSSLTDYEDRSPMTASDTQASAIRIGSPVSFDRAVRQLKRCGGIVTQASEDALADAAALADRHGQFLCPQTAAALAGIREAAKDGRIKSTDRVVLVSTAHGLKFTEFKVGYHQGELPNVESRRRNTPKSSPATLDAVRQVIESSL